jgi:hypothetical protein
MSVSYYSEDGGAYVEGAPPPIPASRQSLKGQRLRRAWARRPRMTEPQRRMAQRQYLFGVALIGTIGVWVFEPAISVRA